MAFDWIGFFQNGVTALSETNMNRCLVGYGAKADFPAAAAGMTGAIAYASDEQKLYVCNETPAWEAVAPGLNIAQTIAGVQTFSSFPVGPSAAPTTDYQLVNKKFVSDRKKVIWTPVGFGYGTSVVFPTQYVGWPCADLHSSNNNLGYMALVVPPDFAALSAAKVVLVTNETGNYYIGCTTAFAAHGQSRSTHTDSVAMAAVASVGSQYLQDFNIADALTGLAAGDRLQISFNRDATNVLDTCNSQVLHLIGAYIEYTT